MLLLAGLVFAVNAHAEDNALASKSVHWYIKAKVITEDIDALKAVISELVEITKTETGSNSPVLPLDRCFDAA